MDIRQLRMNLQLKIVDVFNKNVDKEFIFGERDCHTLTLEIFDAVTGSNALPLIYKKYKTPKGAMRLMVKLNTEIEQFVQRYCEPVPHELMASGDLVLRYNEEYKIHDVSWYLGNNRFGLANNIKGVIEIEQLDVQKIEDVKCYRLTEQALLFQIEPIHINNEPIKEE